MKISLAVRIMLRLMPCMLAGAGACAHPGSGIVVDTAGNIYFTDTGRGVWMIDTAGILSYVPSSRFHWLTIDAAGYFAESPKHFGEYFERVTAQSVRPALLQCSDFPLVVGKDGNMYYAVTRPGSPHVMRRRADGGESVLSGNKLYEFIGGIAAGPDSSLYVTVGDSPDSCTIRKITMNGTESIVATYPGTQGKDLPLETVPSYCRGLDVDSAGTVYVAATGSRSLLRITPQGEITTVLQTASPWSPTGVAVVHDEVYVLEWHDVPQEDLEVRTAWVPRVRKIARDGTVTTVATVSR